MIVAGQNVELRMEFEPANERDKNAIIVETHLPSSGWTRVGYIPKEKVSKCTKALRQNKIKTIKFKKISSQYSDTYSPIRSYVGSLLVTKVGRWQANDYNYRYNHKL